MLVSEVYKRIMAVNILPVLAVMDRLQFVDICVGSTDPKHPPCAVVPPSVRLPDEVSHLVQSCGLGGTPHRVFLRKLYPHQGIPPHVDDWIPADSGIRRFHVPLTSHPEIKMRWPADDIEAHLAPGWLYEVRFNRTHEVVNNTDSERIHIQIDQVGATIV